LQNNCAKRINNNYTAGGRKTIKEQLHRGSSSERSESRFLQYTVSSTQEPEDLRPVINLKPLNKYLRKQHFKMNSMKTVLNLIQRGDLEISIDLKDAYLHIPMFPNHKNILQICSWQNNV
jgi:hypothetical protein